VKIGSARSRSAIALDRVVHVVAGHAAAADPGNLVGTDALRLGHGAGDYRAGLVHHLEHVALAVVLARELHVEFGLVHTRAAAGADPREDLAHLGKRADRGAGFARRALRLLDPGTERHLEPRLEFAAVHPSRELERDRSREWDRDEHRSQRQTHYHHAVSHRMLEQPPVGVLHGDIALVEGAVQPAMLIRGVPAQESRAQTRGERERDQQRHRHCEDHGQSVLEEEAPDHALHERDWDEDREDRERCRHHRRTDLGRSAQRRLHRRLALLEVPMDVLQHHDRVVDQDPCRDGERHQGEDVQREARCVEQEEAADHGRGDRSRHDQRGAAAQQERCSDRDREDAAQHHVARHVAHRRLDEARDVLGHLDSHPGRCIAAQRVHLGHHRPRHLDGVASRLAAHQQRNPWHPVQFGVRALVLEPILDARHVADAYGPRALAPRNHQLAELGDRLHLSARLERELRGAPAGLQSSARDLGVLRAKCLHHVVGSESVGAQSRAVQPDPDLALAPADARHRTHAHHALEALLHDVVGEARELAHRLVARDHHREDRRRVRIEFVDQRRLGVERQFLPGDCHLVADRLGGDVRIHLQLEPDEYL
jgi:hypothetical protein